MYTRVVIGTLAIAITLMAPNFARATVPVFYPISKMTFHVHGVGDQFVFDQFLNHVQVKGAKCLRVNPERDGTHVVCTIDSYGLRVWMDNKNTGPNRTVVVSLDAVGHQSDSLNAQFYHAMQAIEAAARANADVDSVCFGSDEDAFCRK